MRQHICKGNVQKVQIRAGVTLKEADNERYLMIYWTPCAVTLMLLAQTKTATE